MAALALERMTAVALGKGARILSRSLGHGAGTTLPGFLAQKVDAALLPELAAAIPRGVVVVSGTNGKTTSCRLLAAALRAAGLEPIHNHEGSNLPRGLATTLLAHSDALGRLRATERSLGLFELDEGALPALLRQLAPRVVVLTNLFRDQLDRYFELDYLAELWRRALERLPDETVLALNADDPLVASLASGLANPVLFFGLEDVRHARPKLEHAADARRCLACGADLAYAASFYAHLGHYRCPACGWARPRPALAGREITLNGLESSTLELATADDGVTISLPLPGLHNVYNALAAAAAVRALNLPLSALAAVASVRAAFGRFERVELDGRTVYLVLIKNPSGFNAVLRTLAAEATPKHLLLALNDNVPDGRDVSWIWDVDFERLRGQVALVVSSGLRAHDLALRLKHAEWFRPAEAEPVAELVIERDVVRALAAALAGTPPGKLLYVVPTYTAMWELREALRKAGHLRPLWE